MRTRTATRTDRPRRRRLTPEEREQMQRAALERARNPRLGPNIARVLAECAERGFVDPPPVPGRTVLTFTAWRALGRTVRRGERGIRIPVVIPTPNDPETGEPGRRIIHTAAVFHVSQTDPLPPAK
jgi:antirestriction protein ArdC